MKQLVTTALVVTLFLCAHTVAQTVNGTVSGVISDASRALIPGVSVTLLNNDTGIPSTTVSNESGTYNFLSVPPGNYTVTATLPGFKTAVNSGVAVGTSAQVRINFTMEVGAVASKVEVTATAESALLESSASVGDVLPEYRIRNLPLVSNNVLDLLDILPGMRTSPVGVAFTTIGGLGLDSINTTRDGLSITDGRYSAQTYGTQVFSPTTINPDLVGEIRLILSPVDAELGRGNAQIQIQTRSGTNRYTGSAVWNVQNSALNSNTWANNRNTVGGVWSPIKPDWRNTNQITLSYGGPIVRNKTFFFALWDQNINNTRDTINNTVMTDTARQGIFRYWAGYNPLNLSQANSTLPAAATTAGWRSVDDLGRPVAPTFNVDGVTPYTGGLRCFSVFGSIKVDGSPFTQADCAGGTAVLGTAWDTKRTVADPTGYIRKILELMPHANDFNAGDGLNTARFRWIRGRDGSNSTNSIVGSDAYSNRKQINVKIDQNFKNHRISGNWSYQLDDSADNVAEWPGGFTGVIRRRPVVLTVNATSTLGSTLLNEARFGMNHNSTATLPAWLSPNDELRTAAEALLVSGGTAKNGYVYPVVINPSAGNYGYVGNGYMAPNPSQIGNTTPLYNWADTVSWTKGKHAYKFGAEIRLPRSNGYNLQPLPTVTLGNNANASATVSPFATLTNYATELPGLLQTARGNVTNQLYFLNGSVSGVAHPLWIENSADVTNGTWQDVSTRGSRLRDQHRLEWNAFVKDDFKVTRRLTLNLGIRYEYYASPYLKSGLTSAPIGLGEGLFGPGSPDGNLFGHYLLPGNLYLTGYGSNATTSGPLACAKGVNQAGIVSTCDPNLLTRIAFVGPNSPNPDLTVYPKDRNNFGPAIGFAWNPDKESWLGRVLPFLADGKTSIRGGYQITFQGVGRNGMSNDTLLGSAPGNTLTNAITVTDSDLSGILADRALNLSDIPVLVPRTPLRAPGQVYPIYGRAISPTAYDPNYATPYTENITLSITRPLARNVTLDVRYVGTIGKKTGGNLNLNDVSVFQNKELFDALVLTRAGGDAPLFDQMFAGLNLNNTVAGYGSVGTSVLQPATSPKAGETILQRGSAHLRRSTTFAANLANGNFEAVVSSLLTLTPTGLQSLPIDPSTGQVLTGVQQRVLRNGCDRIANGLTNIATRCFPEDYFIANPQFATATYNANLGHSNYQSAQVNVSVRPVQGVNFQATYSIAKTMELPGSGFTDPLNRNAYDYQRGRGPLHNFRTNGTFELPIGPNKLLFPGASGWVARAIERWQVSLILNASSGAPSDVTGQQTLYANGRPDVVSSLWEAPKGKVEWISGNTGAFYGSPSPYVGFRDPQCSNSSLVGSSDSMGFNLQGNCTLNGMALVVPDGTEGSFQLSDGRRAVPLLQNALPGKQGTLALRSINYWGTYTLDASGSKTFRVTESKSVQVRVDARNVLNKRNVGIPSQSMTTFGQITGKGGETRTFQGQLRFTF